MLARAYCSAPAGSSGGMAEGQGGLDHRNIVFGMSVGAERTGADLSLSHSIIFANRMPPPR